MRRQDKRLLPPKLKVDLPKGFYIERRPNQYLLYGASIAEARGARVVSSTLWGVFTGDSTASEIEEYARGVPLKG